MVLCLYDQFEPYYAHCWGWGRMWQLLAQRVFMLKTKCSDWMRHDCQQTRRRQMKHGGKHEGCAELHVLRGIDDQNSSLFWCLYEAHGNQGFGLLRLTPALLTTASWLFLSISICCLFSVRAANSLGFRQLFIFVFVRTEFSGVLAQG